LFNHIYFRGFIENHIKAYNSEKRDNYLNVLIIIDDFITQINSYKRSPEIQKLAFNRRHLIKNGMISILITSQKFNLLPTPMRSNLTLLITYALNDIDWSIIEQQIIREDSKIFRDIIKTIFKKKDDFMIYRGKY
jgi:hypothetical protein